MRSLTSSHKRDRPLFPLPWRPLGLGGSEKTRSHLKLETIPESQHYRFLLPVLLAESLKVE